MDDQVDLEPDLLGDAAPVLDLVGANARDLNKIGGFGLRDHAGQQIGFIGVRDRDEHLGFGQPGSPQGCYARRVPLYDLGV